MMSRVAAAAAAAALVVGGGLIVKEVASATPVHEGLRAMAVFDASTPGSLGNKAVHGAVVVSTEEGTTHVRGHLAGLQGNTLYVAVPYTDPKCTPLPGVTAFPSGAFFTTAAGTVHLDVTVKPTSINPAGHFDAAQTRSVSVRRVIVQGVTPSAESPVKGLPTQVELPKGYVVALGVPTVPNVAYTEACDTHPDLER